MVLVWKRERNITGRLVVKGRIILKCFFINLDGYRVWTVCGRL